MKNIKFVLVAVFPFIAAAASAQSPDWSAWNWKAIVEFPGYSGSETLEDFPALVRLDALKTAQIGDASELRFSDAVGNMLPHEIDFWDDGAGESAVWVRVPSLDSAAAILMYWDNPNADTDAPPPSATGVWAGNAFSLVMHFNEPNGENSVTNAVTGNAAATLLNSNNGRPASEIGSCVDLTGEYNNCGILMDSAHALNSAWTVSAWFKELLPATTWRTLTRSTSVYGTHHFLIGGSDAAAYGAYANEAGTWFKMQGDGSSWWHGMYGANGNTPHVFTDDGESWRLITVTGAGGVTSLHIDGELIAEGAYQSTDPILGIGFYQGAIPYNKDDVACQQFAKYLDEVRVSGAARSADWIKAEYDTVADAAFAAVTPFGGSSPVLLLPEARDVAWTNAQLTALADGTPFDVFVCWGTQDAEYDTNVWEFVSEPIAVAESGIFAFAIDNLIPATNYFARFAIDDGAGGLDWVEPRIEFRTWAPLRLEFVQNAYEQNFTEGIVNVVRDAAPESVSGALEVFYDFAGVAPNPALTDTNFVALSGTLTLPAGAASAPILIKPKMHTASSGDTYLRLALAPGDYIYDPAPTNVVIVKFHTDPRFNTWVAPPDGDGLASTPANWSFGHAPLAGENVLLGVYSGEAMVWDCDGGANGLSDTVASWTQTADYSGAVTFNITYPDYDAAFTNFHIAGDILIESGSWTHPANYATEQWRLRVTADGDFTLGAEARINVNERGYANWNCHPGGAAGVHAGSRFDYANVYGDVYAPENLGSAQIYAGGGAVWLDIAGDAVVDGAVSANTIEWRGTNDNHPGAGGSIYLRAASIEGAGSFAADGGLGVAWNYSGSGGRIALIATDSDTIGVPYENLTARGDSCAEGGTPGGGTIYLKTRDQTHGTLIVDSQMTNIIGGHFLPSPTGTTPVPIGEIWTFDKIITRNHGVLSVPEGATLVLPGGFESVSCADEYKVSGILYAGGTIDAGPGPQIIQNGWVFHAVAPYTFTDDLTLRDNGIIGCLPFCNNIYAFVNSTINVEGDLTVSADSAIYAVNTGIEWQWGEYRPGAHGGQAWSWDVMVGKDQLWGGDQNLTNNTYGSVFFPVTPGTCGRRFTYYDSAYRVSGGGAVILNVTGELRLDGVANASAHDYTWGAIGSGAGGSINITAGTLTGAGHIEANSYRLYYDKYKSSGAGGRVAVRLTAPGATFDAFGEHNITAHGWSSLDDNNNNEWMYFEWLATSAGTVYLQTAADGEGGGRVIVRNDRIEPRNPAITPLPSRDFGGTDDDYKAARLEIGNGSRVKLFDDLRMTGLAIETDSSLDLFGKRLTVRGAKDDADKIPPGVYSAGAFAFLSDTSDSADGELIVLGDATILIIR
ncbi:MAG: DUF2341 domain-containing protein [Kiritimatiellaeota bacterium]|nr:DUF2341 domain-containing protein [Kiritimatiellota bacterium]